ncbi:hypothetical protein B0J17DRAFT_89167 [Rhizoctonia solani]|nr:hypothetical protein B0J17DRAFT_89167 [Rhizoctonia solani]
MVGIGEIEYDRFSSCLPRERCQSAEAHAEHRVLASPDDITLTGTSVNSLQIGGIVIVTAGCLPASSNSMPPNSKGLKLETSPLSSTDRGGSPELPSAVFDEIGRQPAQVFNHPRETCGISSSSDIWKPVDVKSQDRTSNSMTPGQASLFDALLSLGYPRDECHNYLISRPETMVQKNTIQQPPDLETEDTCVNGDILEDPGASRDVNNYTTRSLSLDRNVESNTLPFILNAYDVRPPSNHPSGTYICFLAICSL